MEEKELETELEHGEIPDLEFEHSVLSTEEAFEQLAKALGKTAEEVNDIWQRGCETEGMAKELEEAKGDSEIFEKLAEIRGISKNEMKDEILWALGKAQTEKLVYEIMEQNPGMNRETAEELARFRLGARKEEKTQISEDDWSLKLKELEEFMANHSGEALEKLAAEVVSEWEGGIPLEKAFGEFALSKKNEELAKELENLKAEKLLKEQEKYAREHTPGSAVSPAGEFTLDEFAAGLFKEY